MAPPSALRRSSKPYMMDRYLNNNSHDGGKHFEDDRLTFQTQTFKQEKKEVSVSFVNATPLADRKHASSLQAASSSSTMYHVEQRDDSTWDDRRMESDSDSENTVATITTTFAHVKVEQEVPDATEQCLLSTPPKLSAESTYDHGTIFATPSFIMNKNISLLLQSAEWTGNSAALMKHPLIATPGTVVSRSEQSFAETPFSRTQYSDASSMSSVTFSSTNFFGTSEKPKGPSRLPHATSKVIFKPVGMDRSSLKRSTTKPSYKPMVSTNSSKCKAPTRALPKTEGLICGCPRTSCLKLYCVCFQAKEFCNEDCVCKTCKNIIAESGPGGALTEAIAVSKTRHPQGFVPKVRVEGAGCACKKNRCLKMYCQCFCEGIKCDEEKCKCASCQNRNILSVKRQPNPTSLKKKSKTKRIKRKKTKQADDDSMTLCFPC